MSTALSPTKLRAKHRYEKDCWPLYSLQGLPPNRFASVVSKVIDGRYVLLAAEKNVSPNGNTA